MHWALSQRALRNTCSVLDNWLMQPYGNPNFAATIWYVLKFSVPDDYPSRSSTPTHRQTAERSCIG